MNISLRYVKIAASHGLGADGFVNAVFKSLFVGLQFAIVRWQLQNFLIVRNRRFNWFKMFNLGWFKDFIQHWVCFFLKYFFFNFWTKQNRILFRLFGFFLFLGEEWWCWHSWKFVQYVFLCPSFFCLWEFRLLNILLRFWLLHLSHNVRLKPLSQILLLFKPSK